MAGRRDTQEHWHSWQWSESTTGWWKSVPRGWGHFLEWHMLVCSVCESASSQGMLLPAQGHRGSQEQIHGMAQTVRGAEGCRKSPGE